jgi:hypothetical protein
MRPCNTGIFEEPNMNVRTDTVRADIALYLGGHGASSAVLQIGDLVAGDQFDDAGLKP